MSLEGLTPREQREIAWANSSGRVPVVFIHGLWLLAGSWSAWRGPFDDRGYVTLAPGWPGEPPDVEEARAHPGPLAGRGIAEVTAHFASVLRALERRPVVVGHSLGGLVAQRLAGQGLAAVTVAISPAPFRGVLPLPLAALRSAFPLLRNPAHRSRAIALTFEQFRYAWANALPEPEARALFEAHHVAAPARPVFQVATANLDPFTEARVELRHPLRGPLLLVAGEEDHTVPPALVKAAHALQRRNPGTTEYAAFPGRGHSLTIDAGWREVAAQVHLFIERTLPPSAPRRGATPAQGSPR